jgi:hypothetical protein
MSRPTWTTPPDLSAEVIAGEASDLARGLEEDVRERRAVPSLGVLLVGEPAPTAQQH